MIATGTLPAKSAEFGHDEDVQAAIKALFPDPGSLNGNAKGGAVLLKTPDVVSLRETLDAMIEVPDVAFGSGGPLCYIHKIKDGRHVCLLANLGEVPVRTFVRLRGRLEPELWDPHTGGRSETRREHTRIGGAEVTTVEITFDPTKSVVVTPLSDGS